MGKHGHGHHHHHHREEKQATVHLVVEQEKLPTQDLPNGWKQKYSEALRKVYWESPDGKIHTKKPTEEEVLAEEEESPSNDGWEEKWSDSLKKMYWKRGSEISLEK